MSVTNNLLDRNGGLDIPNEREDGWEVENESDQEVDNDSEDSETLKERNDGAALNVSGLIQPIQL